ncbi:MAG: helicase-exonuclease AddAB subunit AddB [Bacillota bacterium]|jgi:ATP-dependent helicase/nuclease subunit B
MVCRFILGRAGSGKTYYCLETMSKGQKNFTGKPLLLLVPEQATFIYERALAVGFSSPGFCQQEVTSFSRLIYRARERKPALMADQLSETGRKMLIAKILYQRQAELKAFSLSAKQIGFPATVLQTLSELKMYDISLDDLKKALEDEWINTALADKLADLYVIYENFQQLCGQKYQDPQDGLNFLADQINNHGFLSDSYFLVDGFADFTPQELQVLSALMKRAARVEIALTVDPHIADKEIDETDLFYPVWHTMKKLRHIAIETGIKLEEPLRLGMDKGRFAHNQELAFVERSFFPITCCPVWKPKPQNIDVAAAFNQTEEIMGIGREILYLVREKGLRYRDISVIARDIARYEQILETVFGSLGIPFFVDTKKPLLYNPLIELIRSALEVATKGWHYTPLFRYLKNPLSPLDLNDADELENYCLAAGIRHYHWPAEKYWSYYPQDFQSFGQDDEEKNAYKEQHLLRLNQLRRDGTKALAALCQSIKACQTVKQVVEALTVFLTQLQVPEKLQHWQQAAIAQGDYEQASGYRQVWEKVDALLAEAAAFLGNDLWEPHDICGVFDAALADLKIALPPPGLDEVFVASLERSRNPDIKVSFIIGANEGQFPARIMADGIFSAMDREDLALAGLELAPSAGTRQLQENYLVYIALTRAKEKMYISYCLSDDSGQEQQPSFIISRLKELYPQLSERMYGREQEMRLITGGMVTLADLAREFSQAVSGQSIEDYWRDVYNYYLLQTNTKDLLQLITKGLHFVPQAHKLHKSSIKRLFGSRLRSSVSRLEKFRSCPLAYFANYGLKLSKRSFYELNPLNRGQLFHEVLADLVRRISEEKISWHDIDEQKAEQLVEDSIQQFLPRFLGNILASSARYVYLAQRIKNTIKITLLLLAEHMKKGSFRPVAWEIKFGRDGLLPPLKIPLDNGCQLEISGQIDRIDMAIGSEKTWFRIIDYKTGRQNVTVPEIFHGLKLQLLLYLHLVLDHSSVFGIESTKAAGAGIYYSIVRDDIESVSLADIPGSDKENMLGLRLEGLTVKDQEAVSLADSDFNGFSSLIPVGIKGDGTFRSNSPGITASQLQLLRQHLLHILQQTAGAMLQGLIMASPEGHRNFSQCSYCDYRAFCGFDYQLAEKKAAPLPYQEQEIWKKLQQEVSDDE